MFGHCIICMIYFILASRRSHPTKQIYSEDWLQICIQKGTFELANSDSVNDTVQKLPIYCTSCHIRGRSTLVWMGRDLRVCHGSSQHVNAGWHSGSIRPVIQHAIIHPSRQNHPHKFSKTHAKTFERCIQTNVGPWSWSRSGGTTGAQDYSGHRESGWQNLPLNLWTLRPDPWYTAMYRSLSKVKTG